MASAPAILGDLELAELAAAVGPGSFDRGRVCARRGRVMRVQWDAGAEALRGTVVGQGGLYETAAFFAAGGDGTFAFAEGECSCPVGFNCKHVAALVIAAASVPRPSQDRAAPPAWEQPLRALIGARAPQTAADPLAIELSLQTGGQGALRLTARLMRPGARGGWANGSLTWSGLDAWQVRNGPYRIDHVTLLNELSVLQRAGAERRSYYSWYGYGADKTLDLAGCGPQLWPLLDEGARTGLALIHARKELGELRPYRRGEVVLDVTRPVEQQLQMRALLQVDDADPDEFLEPVLFLGARGHGVVCTDRDGRLTLVRLVQAATPPLQRLLLGGEQLLVPVDEVQRFAEELCPALGRVAALISSDGSFVPPEVSAPSLVLSVRYGSGHRVDLGWEWAYRVGESLRRSPLTPVADGDEFRDFDAERAILAGTPLVGTALERYGLLDGVGRPSTDHHEVPLIGIESMRFTTEQLPQLRELAGVVVEIEGEPPDYRDVGETLEIGVATTEIADERDWFELGVTISVEGRELPFADVFAALAGGHSHVLLDDGGHFSLDEPRLQSLRALIEEARTLQDSPTAPLRISRYQAGLWAELAALGVVTAQAQRWRRQVDALLSVDALTDHALPETLQAELRPYQVDGFAWLASLWELELGGILADDMGLGKTLQALALACHAREGRPDLGPFLVVAPTSVVPGWVEEAAHFAPGLRVVAITDTLARSGRPIEELAGADVVVTTYTLLRLDADAYRAVAWAAVVLDEAQYVKNHQAKTYRCVRELDARCKLALTGTPMENNLMELWSLLSITAPGLFPDPKRFAAEYARPIERAGDAERLARLRRRVKPLVKRRSKALVAADLPAKQEQTLLVDLHPRHRKVYDTYLQRERQKILGLLSDFDRNRFTILRSITLLRQLSLHAGLVDPRSSHVPCAKLGALVEQLGDVVAGGHRALVFSQFTRFLTQVRDCLDRERIGYCYLDGRTRSRTRVLERFRDGSDPVFLISLKAGGFGLNLTEADYCFLLDPWWNPATENQAIDRIHRIGQTRPVNVYRLIARQTIEEKVVALARRKAELFRGVMDDGDLFASSLTAEDIRGLLE
ncbi:MAG TPA: SNF2-related protein [Gaiellaceae bacterium]|nr:SNF2-related protein [Gaiellaceae bacterium]